MLISLLGCCAGDHPLRAHLLQALLYLGKELEVPPSAPDPTCKVCRARLKRGAELRMNVLDRGVCHQLWGGEQAAQAAAREVEEEVLRKGGRAKEEEAGRKLDAAVDSGEDDQESG